MKKLLLFLLLSCSLSVNAQVNKKLIHFMLASGGSSTPSTSIANFTFDVDIIQYTDEPIVLDADVVGGAEVLSYTWEIRYKDGTLAGFAAEKSASITTVTDNGFYDLTFTARTATDQYVKTWTDIYVDDPRFDEGEADIVIDLGDGDYYNDFSEADNSGLKIYVKGSGTADIVFVGLFGTSGDPVRIQKSNDNTDVNQVGPDGTAHALYFYQNNEHIRVNGFNLDKSLGWNITGDADNSAQLISCSGGFFTDIQFFGLNTSHNVAIQAATFSFIPPTNATYNATTHVADNMVVWGCTITDAGQEGIYAGYNNQSLVGGYRPVQLRDAIFAWNTIIDSGRDGIQPGGCVNVSIHDNYIDGWGVAQDASHESAISWNSGTYGKCFSNYCINGEMFLNIQSGPAPFDILAGQTTPQKSQFYSNVFISGTYAGSPGSEQFGIYIQNSGGETTAADNWPVEIYNNTIKSDKKIAEAYFHASSFVWTGFKMVNNILVGTTSGGDYPELNFTGPGTQPTGSTLNNIYKAVADQSDIGFTDYAGNDLTIASLSSIAYTGATDVSSYDGELDYDGYPLNASGFAHGAYSGYNKKTITPTTGDPDPATFSTPLAMGSLTQSGGTITFEANKTGNLYWSITTNGGAAPTEEDLRDGGYGLASGTILDAGTAGSYVVTTLTEGTAYDLHGIFVTVDNIPQASVTKVDFTTSADTTAPTVSSMTIADANRDKIVIVFTEAVTGTNAGFTIAGTTSTSFSSIAGTGTNTITGTLATPATYGQTITLAYSSTTGDLRDLATSPNDLVTFGAAAVTNNIAAEPEEYIVGGDLVNVTDNGSGSFDGTGTATFKSVQIIPSTSNGYVKFIWTSVSRGTGFNVAFGLMNSGDAVTTANLDLWLEFASGSTNISMYQGTTFKSSISGGAGVSVEGAFHRLSIDRGTQKIYWHSSLDDTNWTLRGTHDGTVTGDLKFGYRSTTTKGVRDGRIQADLGLN